MMYLSSRNLGKIFNGINSLVLLTLILLISSASTSHPKDNLNLAQAPSPDTEKLQEEERGEDDAREFVTNEWIEHLHTYEDHDGSINTFEFSPNGKFLASSSDDMSLRIFNIEEEKEAEKLNIVDTRSVSYGSDAKPRIRRDKYEVLDLSFSPNGENLAIATNMKIRIIDGENWEEVNVFGQGYDKKRKKKYGHKGRILSLDYSPDGRYIATGSRDATVRIWELDGKKEIEVFDNPDKKIESVKFSPVENVLAALSSNGSITVWDINNSEIINVIDLTVDGNRKQISSFDFTNNGENLVLTSNSSPNINIWDFKADKKVKSFGKYILQGYIPIDLIKEDEYVVFGEANILRVWNIEKKERAKSLRASRDNVTQPFKKIQVSPNDKILAASSRGQIYTWKLDI